MNNLTTLDKIVVLQQELVVLKSRIQDHGTGHIHTAIRVIEDRIAELDEAFLEEQRSRNR